MFWSFLRPILAITQTPHMCSVRLCVRNRKISHKTVKKGTIFTMSDSMPKLCILDTWYISMLFNMIIKRSEWSTITISTNWEFTLTTAMTHTDTQKWHTKHGMQQMYIGSWILKIDNIHNDLVFTILDHIINDIHA